MIGRDKPSFVGTEAQDGLKAWCDNNSWFCDCTDGGQLDDLFDDIGNFTEVNTGKTVLLDCTARHEMLKTNLRTTKTTTNYNNNDDHDIHNYNNNNSYNNHNDFSTSCSAY